LFNALLWVQNLSQKYLATAVTDSLLNIDINESNKFIWLKKWL